MLEAASPAPGADLLGPDSSVPGPEPVMLVAMEAVTRLVLRGGADVRVRAGEALGSPLPDGACRSARHAGGGVLWLGPDEWLITAPPEQGGSLAASLEDALASLHHALVDVSERYVGVMITGARAADVLAAGCPIDLHPRGFPAGSATRTLVGKAEVILLRRDDAPAFELLVGRSFAPYLWRFLVNAGREFGYRIEGLQAR